MGRRLTIDPVTRIEGHAKVIIDLDDNGAVDFAGLVVNELRGFERILVGMEADRMPLVTARICGVCPSAHHLAAVKALENGLNVRIPEAARLQRELLYMGHFIHSHAVHLFALAGPDLIFGNEADPKKRNIVGMVQANPDLAKQALRLRTLGQKINEKVGGRGIHPVTAVIGGMSRQMSDENRRELAAMAEEGLSLARALFATARDLVVKRLEEEPRLADELVQETCYMGTVQGGKIDFYDGSLRLMDPSGEILSEFDSSQYDKHIGEKTTGWSYMKSVFARSGSEEKLYRVGSLARINCADSMGTPEADRELEAFRSLYGRPCHKTIVQLHARLIELLHACEKAVELTGNSAITGQARQKIKMAAGRGAGHVEAPRGALFHDYQIDAQGIVRSANLIVATQQNYDAINESIKQSVQINGAASGSDAMLNAVEFAIRTYDPCLSCATHAVGRMPMVVEVTRGGKPFKTLRRDPR